MHKYNTNTQCSSTISPQGRLKYYYQQYWNKILIKHIDCVSNVYKLFCFTDFTERLIISSRGTEQTTVTNTGADNRCLPEEPCHNKPLGPTGLP